MTRVESEGASRGLRGELVLHVDMSRHVSWRAGGFADRVYVPADLDDLAVFLRTLDPAEPILFVGLGSNLLIRDGGFRGTIVLTHKALGALRLESRRQGTVWAGQDASRIGVVYAEAGVASPKVARFAARHDLIGAEFLAGIPGTIGGALAMNAGCYGRATWDCVAEVLTIDRQGQLATRQARDYRLGYRQVEADPRREEWFVAAWFLFALGDGARAREEIKRLLARRVASQPLSLPNAGSVFLNPPGDYAARLIEACGLKGVRIGDAQVSEMHANFIVNTGHARARDIEALIERVEREVAAKTGVKLTREVRIVGERG